MQVYELLDYLHAKPATATVPFTLSDPHCDRGDYANLAFCKEDVPSTVADLIAVIEAAKGQTFEGYKGGDFRMSDWTDVYIGDSSYDCGEPATFLWLDAVMPTGKDN